MASQFTYDGVPQGKGALLGASPHGYAHIGTTGVVACLGVHVLVGSQRFVAHFDSVSNPKGPNDPLFGKVADYVSKLMTNAAGAFDKGKHSDVATFSTGLFPQTAAMNDGIRRWAGLSQLKAVQFDSFWVTYAPGQPGAIPPGNFGQMLTPASTTLFDCAVPQLAAARVRRSPSPKTSGGARNVRPPKRPSSPP